MKARDIASIVNSILLWAVVLIMAFVCHTIYKTQNDIQTDLDDIKEEITIDIIDDAQNANLSLTDLFITEESLGDFSITYYCTCSKCCGKSNGITASGTVAAPHRTVAVDPNVIPLGTVLMIDGLYYIAEDTGGHIKGKRIDVCVASHDEALTLGTDTKEVFKIGVMPK